MHWSEGWRCTIVSWRQLRIENGQLPPSLPPQKALFPLFAAYGCGAMAAAQGGCASLSELSPTTSSEALLSGKAPTFRLLVWAVDAAGGSWGDASGNGSGGSRATTPVAGLVGAGSEPPYGEGPCDQPLPSVMYVISETFVVATKRVKNAIKSDIPSVDEEVSRLVHIGNATLGKLGDLRRAAHDEGFAIQAGQGRAGPTCAAMPHNWCRA
jgi:hypothetical protein